MDQKGYKGSLTVFLSLSCIFILSLICAAVESVRVQGARTQSANITGMGNFSLLSEYENALLENYEIFAVDVTYGSGKFKINTVNERLKGYLSANAAPQKNFLAELCTDPWRLSLTDCEVMEYQLLTDGNGEAFYQQAVDFMKENAGIFAVDRLLEYAQQAEEIQQYQEEYEKAQKLNEENLSALEEQKQQKLEELKAQEDSANENTSEYMPESNQESQVNAGQELILSEQKENPLDEIRKLRKKSVLSIVTWDKALSGKKINGNKLPSHGVSKRGTMKMEKEHHGVAADVLFREYLMMYFPNYLEKEKKTGLDYQAEYLIGGKLSDEGNLKEVVKRLLLIREGMNYLYCLENTQMNMEAESMAIALTGFLGLPAVTSATKHALLLAWAYGESLIDVRILLDAGKVPVRKENGDWHLSLENLGKLTEILQQGASGTEKGISYQGYLRILLHMGSLKRQKMRALDLIQTELQAKKETSSFRAENCITAIHTKTEWKCGTMFWSLPEVILGIGSETHQFIQEGSLSYSF